MLREYRRVRSIQKYYNKMKIKLLIFALLALVFTACDKNEIAELKQESNIERLEFKSRDEVLLAIQALDSGKNCEILNTHPNFVSIAKAGAMAKKAGLYKVSSDSLSVETAAFDTLVPNKSFAALLSSKGEIVLNDTVFKITPNGTYKYPKNREDIFEALYAADSLMAGTLISEDLYQISEGIYRYDTFKEEILSEEVEQTNAPSYFLRAPASTNSEPNFSTFPTFDADRTSWLGRIIQPIIGSSKSYTVKFDNTNDRRLKGKILFL